MFEVADAAVSDGRCGETVPRQLDVSHEPGRNPGQVWKLDTRSIVTVQTVLFWFLPHSSVLLGVMLRSKSRICPVAF